MNCPFCSVDESRIAFSNDCVIAIWDGFPVSPGHLLIIPRRHAPTWANLSSSEKAATWSAIDQGQRLISERFQPDGFNVGFNEALQQVKPSSTSIFTLSHATKATLPIPEVGCGM